MDGARWYMDEIGLACVREDEGWDAGILLDYVCEIITWICLNWKSIWILSYAIELRAKIAITLEENWICGFEINLCILVYSRVPKNVRLFSECILMIKKIISVDRFL